MKVLFLLLPFPNKLPLFQLPGAAMNTKTLSKPQQQQQTMMF